HRASQQWFYIGRLRTGEPWALGPLVDVATWEQVQSLRPRYSRRHRGSVTRRGYGLAGILACASNDEPRPPREGRVLQGRPVRGGLGRAFKHVAVSARLKADTIAGAARADPEAGDVLALARIDRKRDQAALRLARDRDLGGLEATMARLDVEAAAALARL